MLTESHFTPKGKLTYELAEDRKEVERTEEDRGKEKALHHANKIEQPNADNQARWLKKRKENYFRI